MVTNEFNAVSKTHASVNVHVRQCNRELNLHSYFLKPKNINQWGTDWHMEVCCRFVRCSVSSSRDKTSARNFHDLIYKVQRRRDFVFCGQPYSVVYVAPINVSRQLGIDLNNNINVVFF